MLLGHPPGWRRTVQFWGIYNAMCPHLLASVRFLCFKALHDWRMKLTLNLIPDLRLIQR